MNSKQHTNQFDTVYIWHWHIDNTKLENHATLEIASYRFVQFTHSVLFGFMGNVSCCCCFVVIHSIARSLECFENENVDQNKGKIYKVIVHWCVSFHCRNMAWLLYSSIKWLLWTMRTCCKKKQCNENQCPIGNTRCQLEINAYTKTKWKLKQRFDACR